MKKLIMVLTTLAFIVSAGTIKAEAASTDTITITVTMQKLEIVLKDEGDIGAYGTWAVASPIAPGTPDEMAAGEGVLLNNASNVAVDLEGWSDDNDVTATGWNPGTPAGNKVYELEAKSFIAAQIDPINYTGAVPLTGTASPGNDIETNISAGANRYVYFQFTSPSATDDAGTPHTITATLAATATL